VRVRGGANVERGLPPTRTPFPGLAPEMKVGDDDDDSSKFCLQLTMRRIREGWRSVSPSVPCPRHSPLGCALPSCDQQHQWRAQDPGGPGRNREDARARSECRGLRPRVKPKLERVGFRRGRFRPKAEGATHRQWSAPRGAISPVPKSSLPVALNLPGDRCLS
jgi:hypothetical protein